MPHHYGLKGKVTVGGVTKDTRGPKRPTTTTTSVKPRTKPMPRPAKPKATTTTTVRSQRLPTRKPKLNKPKGVGEKIGRRAKEGAKTHRQRLEEAKHF